MAEKIIGIDLGTTNSCVAVMEGNQSVVVQNSEGKRTTPSVVAVDKKGEHLLGELARRQAVTNPENTIYSIKRMMGRTYPEIKDEVADYPYKVIRRSDGLPAVKMSDKEFTAPEISAQVLTKMKKTAEDYLGQDVKKAVITVPAYFNDAQRQATKDAGRIAGLEVLRIVNEPTAAALAYGLDKKNNVNIAVYDLGGGTFDISILELGDGVFEVKSTNGDTFLGGDNFDHALMDYVASEFKKESGVDLKNQPVSLQRLKEACQNAKCELSTVTETQINLPFVAQDSSGQPVHLDMTVTRPKFEQLISHYIDKSIECCRQAMKDADLNINEINEILLVGGSTRIPKVQEAVKSFFNREPSKGVNPDEVVAMGAAIQAGILGGEVKDILLLDVTPLTWGIETLGSVCTPIIASNTTIPCKYSEVFSTAADNQSSVEIHVLQGERKFARDNKSVGRFTLNELPPAPRGVPQIEVTFDISADGTLNVSALDKATQKSNNIVIKADSGLSEAEIEQMRRDAKEHEDEDNRKKEMVDAVNHGESFAYEIERQLKENAEKISDEQKSEIELNIGRVRESIKGEDVHEIKSATETLQESWHKIARDLYQPTEGAPGANGAPGAGSGPDMGGATGNPSSGAKTASASDDDIIDAEVE